MSQEQETAPGAPEQNAGTPIPGEAPPGTEQGVAPAYREPTPSPDVEQRARRWGWVPKEQWRGHPDRWKPADVFVQQGEEVVPIARDMVRQSEAKIAQLEQQAAKREAEFTDRIRRLEGMTQVALNKQREQLHSQYEQAKAIAASEGNMERYHALNREQAQALSEFQPEAQVDKHVRENPTRPQQQQPDMDPATARAVDEWVGRQPWFDRGDGRGDQALTQAAVAIHGDLRNTRPGLSIQENLAEVEKGLRAAFPWKFGPAPAPNGQQPPAQQQQAYAPSVQGGDRQPQGGGGRAKGWNDLPPEAKASAEKFIMNDGLFLPPGVTPETATDKDKQAARASYAKSYHEQE